MPYSNILTVKKNNFPFSIFFRIIRFGVENQNSVIIYNTRMFYSSRLSTRLLASSAISAREKADIFTLYLTDVFKPRIVFPSRNPLKSDQQYIILSL